MPLLIKGARVIDSAVGVDDVLDILIEDGLIARLAKDIDPGGVGAPDGVDVLDATGLIAAPGFIDMHVHLREPGEKFKEDIESGTRAAAAGGFTAIACMANTDPVNDTSSITERIMKRARESAVCWVYPIGAVSEGLKGEHITEMADQKGAGCVAFSDDGMPVRTAQLMRSALEYSGMLGIPILDHAEDLSLSSGRVMNEGAMATALGLGANPTASEDICVFRDIRLARLTGSPLHILHITSAGAVELVRQAKREGAPVTCEATPHHFTLTDAAIVGFNSAAKMAPPLRSEADRQALLAGLKDGTIDAIASDHAPHYVADLQVEFDAVPFGVVGLETAVPLAIEVLVHGGVLTLAEMIAKFTEGPARILNLPGGTLKEGAPGDVTLLNLERQYEVIPERFESRGRNTPFAGRKLRGCAAATVVRGRIVMNRIAGEMTINADVEISAGKV